MVLRIIMLLSLLPPLPPIADNPYSHSAEVWFDQFCDAAGGDIGWRPEIYPYTDPSTQRCVLKCVNQYCDLPWNDPLGSECDQFWITLPNTWDWSPWCGGNIYIETTTPVERREKVHGVAHNRKHLER